MKNKRPESRNILFFGLVSFFTDISSEMIYPIIPSFLRALLTTTAGKFIGIIEGVAEATASLGKVYFGYISDKLKKQKMFAALGYCFSAFSKILLVFAQLWTHIFSARLLDRIGKSIRTAPRDAILSESVDKSKRGAAFGVQRAMDFAGAFLGSIISLLILLVLGKGETFDVDITVYKKIFMYALFPAFLGIIFLFFIKRPQSLDTVKGKKIRPSLSLKGMDKKLKLFILATFIFSLGNSSNQFLIIRSRHIGFSLVMSLVLYIIYNLSSSLFLPFFGKLSDRIGRKKVILSGYFLYSLVYMGFGFLNSQAAFYILWVLYGIYAALTEGVEKAYVSDLSSVEKRGTALGLFATTVGIGLLPASVIAGFLYTINPSYPFIFGGALSLIASWILLF